MLANTYSALQDFFPCLQEEPEQRCKPFPVGVGEPLHNTLSRPEGTGAWAKRGEREQEKGFGLLGNGTRLFPFNPWAAIILAAAPLTAWAAFVCVSPLLVSQAAAPL